MHKPEEVHRASFDLIGKLGKGAYGTVHMAKNKKTGKLFALKEVDRDFVEKVGKVEALIRERDILKSSNDCE